MVGKANQAKTCFFVDDEPSICQAVARTLRQIGLKVCCFTRPIDCLEQLGRRSCDVLITDLRMPQMDGIQLLTRVKQIMPSVPVLILTGYGDIPTAVKAIKLGAFNFLEKPFSRETLVLAVKSVLGEIAPCKTKRKSLTQMEITILRLILQGRSNREIAHLLSRSERTIEWHRANIMSKLGVNNMVDLAKKQSRWGLRTELRKKPKEAFTENRPDLLGVTASPSASSG